MVLPSAARLASWGGAVLCADVSIDDAVDEITAGALPETHSVLVDDEAQPLPLAFGWLRREGVQGLRLALPAPGDPAGVRASAPAVGAAVLAGEAVVTCGGAHTWLLVPAFGSLGSSGKHVAWHSYAAEPSRLGDQPTLAQADRDLQSALTEAVDELVRLDVARWRPEVGKALAGLRTSSAAPPLPPGYEPRAQRLLTTALRIAAIVDLALDDVGAAVSATEVRGRSAALHSLAAASRRAVSAAVNSVLERDDAPPAFGPSDAAPYYGYRGQSSER